MKLLVFDVYHSTVYIAHRQKAMIQKHHGKVDSLDILAASEEITLTRLNDDATLVIFRDRRWLLWPFAQCWIEIGEKGYAVTDATCGSVADFHRMNIQPATDCPAQPGSNWGKADCDLLQSLVSRNLRLENVAHLLGRTPSSVIAMVGELNNVDVKHLIEEPEKRPARLKAIVEVGNA